MEIQKATRGQQVFGFALRVQTKSGSWLTKLEKDGNVAIRASLAFASMRYALISELLNEVRNNLVPKFNAECADIRKLYEETVELANNEQDEVAKQKLLELAETNKKARILDLNFRKRQFINSLNVRLAMELNERVKEYFGKIVEGTVKKSDGTEKKTSRVEFPDGSSASIPPTLWIDYSSFDRV